MCVLAVRHFVEGWKGRTQGLQLLLDVAYARTRAGLLVLLAKGASSADAAGYRLHMFAIHSGCRLLLGLRCSGNRGEAWSAGKLKPAPTLVCSVVLNVLCCSRGGELLRCSVCTLHLIAEIVKFWKLRLVSCKWRKCTGPKLWWLSPFPPSRFAISSTYTAAAAPHGCLRNGGKHLWPRPIWGHVRGPFQRP